MNLYIDKNVLELFKEENLKVFFYKSGCEWTKINIEPINDFEWLESINIDNKIIWLNSEEKNFLDNWKIVLQIKKEDNWHGWKNKFLFVSKKITSRCWCSSSFSFENKLIDSNKLKLLKNVFKK